MDGVVRYWCANMPGPVVLYTGTEVIQFAANLHRLSVSHLWAAYKSQNDLHVFRLNQILRLRA